ncbi:hypothetical protein ABNR98_004461 [Salmonella enterica]
MPAAKDLTGSVYGKLSVIRKVGYASDSKHSSVYLCYCECGRYEEISQLKLPHNASQSRKRGIRYNCTVCMRGPCVVCGRPIERETKGNTCSETCKQYKDRAVWLKHYSKAVNQDPEFNHRRHLAEVARMNEDPAYAERVRERRRKANLRYAKKPEIKEKRKEYHQQWYEKNKEKKQFLNRLWWQSLPEEVRNIKRRSYWLKSKRKFYNYLAEHPYEYKIFREKVNAYQRERYNKLKQLRVMVELRELAKSLQEKLNNG